jgi:hypothetical protein
MSEPVHTSLTAILGRLVWMLLGPFALASALFASISGEGGWFTKADVAFFLILGAMIVGRWLEFRGGNPLTCDGKPASASDLKSYVLRLLLLALSCWIIANIIGNHLLGASSA